MALIIVNLNEHVVYQHNWVVKLPRLGQAYLTMQFLMLDGQLYITQLKLSCVNLTCTSKVEDEYLNMQIIQQLQHTKRTLKYYLATGLWLSKLNVALSNTLKPLAQIIYAILYTLPTGICLSYQQLATIAGKPKAFRHIASLVACNTVPLVLACHRIIYRNGRIGNYSFGDANLGSELKKILLSNEIAWLRNLLK